MSVQLLIDMNLSPDWVQELSNHGLNSVHWSSVGDARASDREIMDWARAHGYVVFTHDLDFGTMLALSHSSGPSVIQVRSQDVLPNAMGTTVVAAVRQHEVDLMSGALVVVDRLKSRVRVLPL